MSTYANVRTALGVGLTGLGGYLGYRGIREHDQAGDAKDAGNKYSSTALNTKAIYSGLAGVGLATTGVLALATHGRELTGAVKLTEMLASGATSVGVFGGLVAGSGVDNARRADAEITKLRTTNQDSPTRGRHHGATDARRIGTPHHPY